MSENFVEENYGVGVKMRQGMEWKGVAMLSSNEILDIMNQTFMLALRIALPFLLISMIL